MHSVAQSKNELAEIGLFDMYIASDHGNSYPVIVMGKLKPQSNGSLYSNTVIVNWSLMGGLLHLVQQGGAWAGCGSIQSLLAVSNVTAHPSTASVPVTVLLIWSVALRF